uniref:Uncharacterized protein n=1 Tax=Magallana gigas TaxID=29159 RepID=A0A8W8ML01_MAGGI
MHKSKCLGFFLNVLVTELQGVTYGHSSSDSSLMKAQQQSVNFQQQPTGESDQHYAGEIIINNWWGKYKCNSKETLITHDKKSTSDQNQLGWKRGKTAFSSLQYKEVLKEIVRKIVFAPMRPMQKYILLPKTGSDLPMIGREGERRGQRKKKDFSSTKRNRTGGE